MSIQLSCTSLLASLCLVPACQYFETNVDLMDSLFDATFSTLEAVGKPLSRCGKCTRYMKHITSKPPRLHCAHCDETYNLPTMGAIKLFKELVCPLDGCVLPSEPPPLA